MRIARVQKSLLIAIGICALAVAGAFAGRVSADAIPQGSGGDGAPKMFRRIARALDLTDDQKAQVKTILKNHVAEITAQMTASRNAKRALRDAVVAQPLDESAIRARAADAGRVHADGAVLFARIRAEVDPILTDDQREKLKALQSRSRTRADNAVAAFQKFLNSPS
jgi:Spy/CpxP family protein refolding chaperone